MCEGYGNYTNAKGYGNGTYPSYNPWWGTYGSYHPYYTWWNGKYYNECNFGWGGYGVKNGPIPGVSNVSAGNSSVNVTDSTVKGNTYNKVIFDGYKSGGGGASTWGWAYTHGHEGWRCKKPKNLAWWKSLIKGGYDGMMESDIKMLNKHYWVTKEYKH